MDQIWQAQSYVLLVLGIAAFALEAFCLIDATRYPDQAYRAEGKLTKTWWLVILGIAVAVGFVTVGRVLGLGLVGVVAAGIYIADVRPAVRSIAPRRKRRGGGSGPYGSW